MIISHKHRFIFIKTLKTAGTSIEVYLSRHCAGTDFVTPIDPPEVGHTARNYRGFWNPVKEILHAPSPGSAARSLQHCILRRRFYNHIPARTVRHRIPRNVWNTYYKFCVERHPLDKVLSFYHMQRARTGEELSLDEYLKTGPFPTNFPLYTDSNGHVLVDRIVRYESLESHLSEVFDHLGIPFSGDLGVRAKSEYRRSNGSAEREAPAAHQQSRIAELFADEIQLHGYSVDGTARPSNHPLL